MKLSRLFYTVLFCIYISILAAGCNADGKGETGAVVAEFKGDHKVEFGELKTYMKQWFFDKRYPDETEAYNKALEMMIVNKLKRLDFFKRGLDQDKELTEMINRKVNEGLVIKFYETQVLNKYLDEKAIQEAYEKMSYQVEYQQIVLYKGKNSGEVTMDSIKAKLSEIKSEIDQGKDFTELVSKYSEDRNSAQNGGYMPPLSWKKSLGSKMNSVIFDMGVGEVSNLEMGNAYYVVKVTDHQTITPKPLAEVKDEIKSILKERYTDYSLKEFDELKDGLINEEDIVWNEKGIDRVTQWSRIPGFYDEAYKDTLENAIDRGDNFTILEYPDRKVDAEEFLRLLDNILILKSSPNIDNEAIKKYFIDAISTDILVKKAKDLNLQNDIFTAETKDPVMANTIAYLYNQAVIEGQIPEPTDEALKEFYESQKDSLYYQLEKINLYVMVFPTLEEANAAKHKIDSGIAFEDVTRRYLVKTYIKDRSGKIKVFRQPDKEPEFGEEAFKLAESEVDGPLEYNDPEKGKQFVIIKDANRVPEKQLTYEEAKKTIVEDFKEFHRSKISEKVAKELWDEYDVEVHKDVLEKEIAGTR